VNAISEDQERKLNEKIQSLTEKLLETFEELNLSTACRDLQRTAGVEQVIEELSRLPSSVSTPIAAGSSEGRSPDA